LFSFQARRDYISQPADFDPKKPGLDAPYELTTDTAGPLLTGKTPLGLTYGFSGIAGEHDARTDFRFNTNVAEAFPGGIRQTNSFFADAGLTLQQHLLKDFWMDRDSQLVLIRRKDLKISEQALQFQLMKTVLAVELAYYDLVAAAQQVRVQEKALELKQQFVTETKRRVQVGDLPPLDSELAESQLENVRTTLIGAREAVVDRQNTLKNLLSDNFIEWADVELRPTDALTATEVPVNRSESFKSALQNRPDLVEARLVVEKSDVEVRFRKNQLFPNLDLIGHYGGLAVDANANSAVRDTLRFRDPEYYYGVVVSFPLSNLRERSDYRASKAAKKLTELQLRKAEQEVVVQVADYVNRVQSRFSQVGSTSKARTYAEAALAAEEKKLQNGFSTSFFVLQLQEALTGARTAELQALADYNRTLAQLAFAEGTTLRKHHLKLQVK
jgi:outer membrane protein TolC